MEKDDYAQPSSRANGKGKGKEALDDTANPKGEDGQMLTNTENGQQMDGSVVSRLKGSAMALGSSMLSKPEVRVGLSSAGKADITTASNLETPLGESSTYTSSTNAGAASSLRSAQVQDHVAREEAAFLEFLKGTDAGESTAHEAGNITGGMTDDALHPGAQTSHFHHDSNYSDTDGLEVVKLLDSGYDTVAQIELDTPLTKQEEASMRQALFAYGAPSGVNEGVAADLAGLLNFVPEYISNGSSGWGYKNLLQHFGTSDTTEASQIWADQWGDVLSRYTDEVWGDLSPLVQEAKEEARKIQESGRAATPSETKAILRLRQILAHVRSG